MKIRNKNSEPTAFDKHYEKAKFFFDNKKVLGTYVTERNQAFKNGYLNGSPEDEARFPECKFYDPKTKQFFNPFYNKPWDKKPSLVDFVTGKNLLYNRPVLLRNPEELGRWFIGEIESKLFIIAFTTKGSGLLKELREFVKEKEDALYDEKENLRG